MAVIMKGDLVLKHIKELIAEEIKCKGLNPTIVIFMIGENPASQIYVKNKIKDCEECGIKVKLHKFTEDIGEEKLINMICDYNNCEDINGLFCQLPLPAGYNTSSILKHIKPLKDIDGLNSLTLALAPQFEPCTPQGIIMLLEHYNINIEGKNCVIVNRSDIVGKPLAKMLLDKDGTVTICHSKTKNLIEFTRQADILIVAVGKAKFITANMVKDGAVVIDVGINKDENGKLCGDVDFELIKEKASYITPVPGGCGLTTRAGLLKNIQKTF